MLSEASTTSTRSSSYQSALLANMQLLSILDDEAEASIPPPGADSLELRLGRMLSVGSVISTTSSFAEEQDTGAKTGVEAAPYKLIGWGACGAVYTQDGSTKVLKVAKTDDQQLWIDYRMMTRVWEAFARTPEVSEETFVPQPEFFVPRTETRWWEEREGNIPSGVVNLPTAALSSERIFPLPQAIRSELIEKFCQPRNRRKALESESNKDCLVRIYLGSMNGKDGGAFFSLRNFKLHLNHMIDLDMDVLELARYVGGALATLHWQAKVDGRDVEFVLGSSPTNHVYGPLTSEELDRLPFNTYTELRYKARSTSGE